MDLNVNVQNVIQKIIINFTKNDFFFSVGVIGTLVLAGMFVSNCIFLYKRIRKSNYITPI